MIKALKAALAEEVEEEMAATRRMLECAPGPLTR
jgi:hypothetical protein